MTNEKKNDLIRCADQADAHGRVEVARWYRCWAETGRQIGPKPEADTRGGIHGGPVC